MQTQTPCILFCFVVPQFVILFQSCIQEILVIVLLSFIETKFLFLIDNQSCRPTVSIFLFYKHYSLEIGSQRGEINKDKKKSGRDVQHQLKSWRDSEMLVNCSYVHVCEM